MDPELLKLVDRARALVRIREEGIEKVVVEMESLLYQLIAYTPPAPPPDAATARRATYWRQVAAIAEEAYTEARTEAFSGGGGGRPTRAYVVSCVESKLVNHEWLIDAPGLMLVMEHTRNEDAYAEADPCKLRADWDTTLTETARHALLADVLDRIDGNKEYLRFLDEEEGLDGEETPEEWDEDDGTGEGEP